MTDLLPVDLRSDTVTRPTPAMRRAMAECEVGDDARGDDPTVIRLQDLAADMLGKEAALFVPSGTMGNVIAAMAGRGPGNAIVVGRSNHMNTWEAKTLDLLGVRRLEVATTGSGEYDPGEVASTVDGLADRRGERPGLLCLESTHNECGGTVPSLEFMRAARELADRRGMKVHLDGARVFNAATFLGVDVKEIARFADSVMFCLSKGLASPVGSLVCGGRDFIEEARRLRKLLGGAMRQAGVLAACGIVSLNEMTERLHEDHENCRLLAEALAGMPRVVLDLESVPTNIVYFGLSDGPESAKPTAKRLNDAGVLCLEHEGRIRMVTHNDVSREQVEKAIEITRAVFQGCS